jgi:hypothetical protein
VLAFFAVFAGAQAAQRWETLEAIHCVENPKNSMKPGPCGELGAYQFRPETWVMYSKLPFSAALDRRCSDEVAIQHYEWLKKRMERAGVPVTTYNIALAWNAGIDAVLRSRAPSVSHDYASRVTNLALDLRMHQLADSR